MFRTLTTAAILALTVTAAQAGSATVHFGDLNPAKPADAQTLSDRVQVAAEAACASESSGTGLSAFYYKQMASACADRLSRSTRSQIEAIMTHEGKLASN